ncbi:MAG: DapH/DapD/GlmU-related protein [Flavobacteriaceae bacterium]
MSEFIGFGLGIRRRRNKNTLDVLYPKIIFDQEQKLLAQLTEELSIDQKGFYTLSQEQVFNLLEKLEDLEVSPSVAEHFKLFSNEVANPSSYSRSDLGLFVLDNTSSITESIEEAYFKLQCLSQLHVKPHGINLDGIFGILNNIAWSNKGPILVEDLGFETTRAAVLGENLQVTHVDKFPYMINYHIPNGVRVVSGSQVRLGAHLAPGTTVMPAGYVNFNAGTLGNAMVEGRISAGVVVGADTDLGGGASIMGTLSGGNNHVISIGEKCLLGANAGTGISLGNGCTIAAGVYVTAAAKVWLYNTNKTAVNLQGEEVSEGENIVKGSDLSGKDNLLFILDSTNGHLVCRPNTKMIELNESLHQND